MCNLFSKFSKEVINARKYRDETKQMVDSEISEIHQNTQRFLEKNNEYLEKNKKHIAKLSEKMNLAIEENDEAALDAQLNEMMSILSEDKETQIKQEISDEKLKTANIENTSL